jgi:glycosyltransferase involved in cell wall biosynthesis
MKILHVYKDYYPVLGGIENHIRVLAEAQARQGHHVTVLVTHRGRVTEDGMLNGVRVIRAGRVASIASTPISPSFPRLLAGLQPDITHLQAPYPPGELSQLLYGRGRPFVLSYQADVARLSQRLVMLAYGPVFDAVLRRAARVLATSPNFAAHSPALRRVASCVAIVPLGVDVSRFSPGSRAGGRPPVLLFVGRLRHYKGLDVLLHALARLEAGLRLVIAGDGPRRAPLQALAAELGLGSRVDFIGDVPDADLPALYQSAGIFVLPSTSRAESFGTVLVEAMASGLPCVTTEIGSGTSFVVQDAQTGCVVPPRDPATLAGALARLAADPGLRARMGAAGRRRAVENFSLEGMLAAVQAVYDDVLSAAIVKRL